MTTNVNVNIVKPPVLQQKEIPQDTPFDRRFGFWGVVTEVHPEDCTVHVTMDTGRELTGVRVASSEWVTIDKEKNYLSGERHLPPVNTFVFCVMPNGRPETAFVLCSGFAWQDARHAEFKKKDKEKEWEIHENSGWKKITKYEDGSKIIQNAVKDGDEDIKIEIDQSDKDNKVIRIKVYDHKLTIDKDQVELKTTSKKVLIETEKDKFEIDGKIELMAKESDLLKIGNKVGTLGKLFDDLCDALMKLYTNTAMGPLIHKHHATLWGEHKIRPIREKAGRILEK